MLTVMQTLWMYVLLMNVCMNGAAGKKKEQNESPEFIRKEMKKLGTSTDCSLRKMSMQALQSMWFKNQTSDETILCALKFLEINVGQATVWSILGTSYDKRNAKQQATFCFKQVAKKPGQHSRFVKEWYFLGPFVIGKSEFDGDPVAAFGGIRNISKFRFDTKSQPNYFSELFAGGLIKWNIIRQKVEEVVQIRPTVDWNDLVSSLGSLGITEWQGWAVGEFLVSENHLQLSFQCLGVSKCIVGETMIAGDLYHRKQLWFPVNLSRGYHQIFIHLRAKVAANFKFSVLKMPTFKISEPSFLPDIYKGYLPDKSHIAVPISNLMANKWLKVTGVQLENQSDGTTIMPLLDQNVYDYKIAPGQTTYVSVLLGSEKRRYDKQFITECKDVNLELEFQTSEGTENLQLKLRCRNSGSSFLFTFVDHDNSVQHAAAIEPIGSCPQSICPVVLTLHGTTVPPQNQADSYKKMVEEDFQFGVKKMWLLAPTRHGAHNWEGPGALTAMSALKALQYMTRWHDCFEMEADAVKVLFAGHSMGGHGAWHLASHFPDRAIGLISLAGWIKKEEYGDTNLFFKHDISTSHTDPAVKAVMEASVAENDADKHVTNLKGIPVLARIGANDRTVHPFYVRRMVRLLNEAGVSVTYSELPGLEHWWWDTMETNDGGCMNDAQIQKFMAEIVNSLSENQSGSCTSKADKCGDETSASSKYKNFDQDYVTFTTVNPALGEGLKGVTVIQQNIPFRISTVQIAVTENRLTLATQNVKCLQLNDKVPNRGIDYRHIDTFVIDGSVVKLKTKKDFPYTFCRLPSGNDTADWQYISDVHHSAHKLVRFPEMYGPARRIAEIPFVIVVGTQGDQSTSKLLLEHAVYVANQFFLTSDTIVPIIEDKNFESLSEDNVIVIGNPEENLFTSKYLDHLQDLKYIKATDETGPKFQLGNLCTYEDPRTGVLALAQNPTGELGLILMGLSHDGLEDVINLATPTIPPMARSPFSNFLPDFVITGPDVGLKGPGGFLCAGFWDNNWKFLSPSSSCVCVDQSHS